MDRRAVRPVGWALVVLVGLLVGVSVGASGAESASIAGGAAGPHDGGPASAWSGHATESTSIENESPFAGYDELAVEAGLYSNGSAAMTVEYRYRLDDGNETVDWNGLRESVGNETDEYVAWFEGEWENALEEAANETGREMSIHGTSVEVVESSTPPAYGTVRFQFRWAGFAHVEVNRIEAGDALDGFMMDERTRLMISWPEGYENTTVQPEPDETHEFAVVWFGEETQEFLEGEPRVEVIQASEGDPVPTDEEGVPTWLAGIGLVLLAILAGGGWWVTTTGGRAGDRSTESAQSEPTDDPAPPREPPPELLSNEERVLRLLEKRGGRIKQQEVVAELDWTEAKTSQVVGTLREAGDVEVFRIGRENVLTLPDEGDAQDG